MKKKMSEMTPEERKAFFMKIGKKGGLASKAKGTDYRALAKKSPRNKAKKAIHRKKSK